MKLTPAEQWASQYQLPDRVTFIRQIQADAIRWTILEIQKQHDISAILDLANQLHPKQSEAWWPNKPTGHQPDCHCFHCVANRPI